MIKNVVKLSTHEQGQGMTEYGIVLGVLSIAVIGAMAALRPEIMSMYENVLLALGAG